MLSCLFGFEGSEPGSRVPGVGIPEPAGAWLCILLSHAGLGNLGVLCAALTQLAHRDPRERLGWNNHPALLLPSYGERCLFPEQFVFPLLPLGSCRVL